MKRIVKNDLKIIFIVPADNCEYLGIGLLSSRLKSSGITNIAVVPARLSRIEAVMRGASLCVLAFSPFSFCAEEFLKLAKVMKTRHPRCITVFGGPHATFAPEIIYADGVDAVCRGEGEEAFLEFLLECIKNPGVIPTGIKNWWVKDASGNVHKNEARQVAPELDALPFSDKSLFTNTLFFKRGFRRFIFSRGCMYRCAYCSVPSYEMFYEKVSSGYRRLRSVESALSEIRAVLGSYGGSVIGIIDSIFGADAEWLEKFSYQYKKEIGLPFYCHTGVHLVSERYVSLLKDAGCYFLLMGLECANESVRSASLNKHFTNEQFESAARRIQEKGIRLGVYNMIGIPGSVLEDDLQTLKLNQKIRPHLSEFHVFSFYPGIALYDQWKTRMRGSRVEKSVYWTAITSSSIRSDLAQVIRLHYLFGLMVCLNTPLSVIRILTKLPLGWLYRFVSNIFARAHYRRYDPEVKDCNG